MEYRKLGKWGMRVSEIGLGSWLTFGSAVEENSSIKQIHFAFDCGINFFDTANCYGNGDAEVVVGKALKTLKRDSCVLATKVYMPMGEGPNDKGLSRKHVFEQCHASLKRLHNEYIDLYQCHRYDEQVPMYEVVRTMDDLIRQGKIIYWGVSEWPAERIEEACEVALSIGAMPPISNQPHYNMLARGIESSVIPVSKKHGLGQVIFSPLAQGVLTGKYKPGQPFPADSRAADSRSNFFLVGRSTMNRETLEIVQKLEVIAKELSLTMSQLALAWCLRLSEISSVITGSTKPSQIDENIKASGLRLPPEVLAKIDNALRVAVHT
jgi:voltage-dependent potassium channel beta subunit